MEVYTEPVEWVTTKISQVKIWQKNLKKGLSQFVPVGFINGFEIFNLAIVFEYDIQYDVTYDASTFILNLGVKQTLTQSTFS